MDAPSQDHPRSSPWRKAALYVAQGLSQGATRNGGNSSETQEGHQEQCSSCEMSQVKLHKAVHRKHYSSLAEITHKPNRSSQPCTSQRQTKTATTVPPVLISWNTATLLHLKLFHWLRFKNKINPANIAKQLAVSATSHPIESICPLHDLLARSSLLSPCQILYIQLSLASPDAWLD